MKKESTNITAADEPYWRRKTLSEMTKTEWEMLCDGCGRCCLNKLEDETTGEIFYTDIACRLLDLETCRCTSYDERKRLGDSHYALPTAFAGLWRVACRPLTRCMCPQQRVSSERPQP